MRETAHPAGEDVDGGDSHRQGRLGDRECVGDHAEVTALQVRDELDGRGAGVEENGGIRTGGDERRSRTGDPALGRGVGREPCGEVRFVPTATGDGTPVHAGEESCRGEGVEVTPDRLRRHCEAAGEGGDGHTPVVLHGPQDLLLAFLCVHTRPLRRRPDPSPGFGGPPICGPAPMRHMVHRTPTYFHSWILWLLVGNVARK